MGGAYVKKEESLPIRAPKTKMMQTMMKASIAVKPSAFGILLVMLLKILTRTRKTVTRMVMRPGTLSGGTKKLERRLNVE